MIRYKAEREGIRVLVQEESYTSKASFLDRDDIPVYDKENPAEYRFSGRRITRGLYRSENGTVISSDINGSANILRKAFPEAFEGMDVSYLQKVKTIKFFNLHSCRPKN
jgi:putative transposase